MNKQNLKSVSNIDNNLINKKNKTVEIILSDETKILRYDFWEDKTYNLKLLHNDTNIKLDRASILKVFYQHDTYNLPIAKIENLRIEDNKLKGTAVFDTDDEFAMKIFKKVQNGFLESLSVGINVLETKEVDESNIEVTLWELLEVSFVNIPANPNAKIGLQKQNIGVKMPKDEKKDENLNVETIKKESFDNGFQKGVESERARLAEIAELKGGGQDEYIDNLSLEGLSAEKIAYKLQIKQKEAFKAKKEANELKNIELNKQLAQLDNSDSQKDDELLQLQSDFAKSLKGV